MSLGAFAISDEPISSAGQKKVVASTTAQSRVVVAHADRIDKPEAR